MDRILCTKQLVILSLGGAIGYLAPIKSLLILATIFVFCDYISSIIATIEKNKKRKIKDVSKRYVYITGFSLFTIILSFLLNRFVIGVDLVNLEGVSASIICVYSLNNFIKNALFITKNKAFMVINKHIKLRFDEQLNKR